ncbi:uncharacterized protein LY79DRAFT_241603 [Colletotrichum navitas]|uniref:Uncharacterized protein n=1 Tax=Colletotrichum navitas TaxID=681940 RepID=A0AAD8PWV5_9PEZI|nr:uncharacterized protein LY79DRAFT_241603 [Colletotrichum navitas]KAK1586159.1 hypothetical protein LY79DRAFT_241603 [Colletotrichum navitas]
MIDHDYRESFDLSTAQLSTATDTLPWTLLSRLHACIRARACVDVSSAAVCRFVDMTFACDRYLPPNRFPPVSSSLVAANANAQNSSTSDDFSKTSLLQQAGPITFITHPAHIYSTMVLVLYCRRFQHLSLHSTSYQQHHIPLLFRHSSFPFVMNRQTNGQPFDQC